MRVLYDHQIFSRQRFGGVSRYFAEIIGRLSADGACDARVPILFSNNEYLPATGRFHGSRFFPGFRFRGRDRLMASLNRAAGSLAVRTSRFDLFHPTYFEAYFLPRLKGRPFVLTVYDMILEMFPKEFDPNHRLLREKRRLAEAADRILAISHRTKDDLVRLFGVPEEKVVVTHLSDSFAGMEPAAAPRDPDRPYLLFVGVRGGYKNFATMARGLAPLLREEANLRLVCAGGGAPTPSETALLGELGIRGQVDWKQVSDAELVRLYAGATAFLFPSRYEGFGIPILEAFRCGCPALLSRASCFPEIAGDGAAYFDPESPSEIGAAARKVLEDREYADGLRRKGRKRLEAFSWEKTAAETLAAYRAAAGR